MLFSQRFLRPLAGGRPQAKCLVIDASFAKKTGSPSHTSVAWDRRIQSPPATLPRVLRRIQVSHLCPSIPEGRTIHRL